LERPAEPAEGWSVDEVVIEDESDNAFAVAVDQVLRQTQELDVVVLEPLRVALAERLAVDAEVAFVFAAVRQPIAMEGLAVPGPAMGGAAAPGRIPKNDVEWLADDFRRRLQRVAEHGRQPLRRSVATGRAQEPLHRGDPAFVDLRQQ